MQFFNRLREIVFYKESDDTEKRLGLLRELKSEATGETADLIELEIRLQEAGLYGEKQIRFELENSHIPMFVLHDLYLEHDGLTSQIDYLVLTDKKIYIIECKNLVGDIEINRNGDFIRRFSYGRYTKKEGLYSPITQNMRHFQLVKKLRSESLGFLERRAFENNYEIRYRPIVVLSNPKTVLNMRYAPKEIRNQVMRADQLVNYIRNQNQSTKVSTLSKRDLENAAEFFLNAHQEKRSDYLDKFRDRIKEETINEETDIYEINSEIDHKKQESEVRNTESIESVESVKAGESTETILCPRCGAPMVKRVATKGKNKGQEFYGCSNFPRCRGIVNIDT